MKERLGFQIWNHRPAYWDTERHKCYSAERMSDKAFKSVLRFMWDQLAYAERYPLTRFVVSTRLACNKGKKKIQLP